MRLLGWEEFCRQGPEAYKPACIKCKELLSLGGRTVIEYNCFPAEMMHKTIRKLKEDKVGLTNTRLGWVKSRGKRERKFTERGCSKHLICGTLIQCVSVAIFLFIPFGLVRCSCVLFLCDVVFLSDVLVWCGAVCFFFNILFFSCSVSIEMNGYRRKL